MGDVEIALLATVLAVLVAVAVVIAIYVAFHWKVEGSSSSSAMLGNNQASSSASEQDVTIEGFLFVPETIVIPVGTTVVWTNRESGINHTSTADDGSWDSGVLTPGQSFSHTFESAGTFPYHCAIHPQMHGTVMVSA